MNETGEQLHYIVYIEGQPMGRHRDRRRDNMETKQDERLGTEPIGRLILQMAVPAVAAQLINVLYNIVDRIYIGHIAGYGDMALTGSGRHFPRF